MSACVGYESSTGMLRCDHCGSTRQLRLPVAANAFRAQLAAWMDAHGRASCSPGAKWGPILATPGGNDWSQPPPEENYRETKTATHTTRGGVGVVGRLRGER